MQSKKKLSSTGGSAIEIHIEPERRHMSILYHDLTGASSTFMGDRSKNPRRRRGSVLDGHRQLRRAEQDVGEVRRSRRVQVTHGVIETVPETPPRVIRGLDNLDQYNAEGRRSVRLFLRKRSVHVEIVLSGGLDGRSVQSGDKRFSLMVALLPQEGEERYQAE